MPACKLVGRGACHELTLGTRNTVVDSGSQSGVAAAEYAEWRRKGWWTADSEPAQKVGEDSMMQRTTVEFHCVA